MLTYDLNNDKGPLYERLYRCIKDDINNGKLKSGEKLPSKRTLADNLGVSSITVENAYLRLIDEGYLYSVTKRGYFVSDLSDIPVIAKPKTMSLSIDTGKKENDILFDFSSNRTEADKFPFSTWAKLTRELVSMNEKELLQVSPPGGVLKLRMAIARHLSSFRGMVIDPDQIVVGAGTEYLYGLLIKLLGSEKYYAIENPGYKKISQIYDSNNVYWTPVNMDAEGMSVTELRALRVDIAHISPIHQFPTGITMSASRKKDLLKWVSEDEDRFIIEDEYDSEFRLNGKPVSPLFNSDTNGKVIYVNTFSKSLTSTIRISYMVLPETLANKFYKELGFYSNTVSTFEQYTLAEFINRGYFEKHINRMRLHYGRKRKEIFNIIYDVFKDECNIIESDSGLHFLLEFKTDIPDDELEKKLYIKKIKLNAITGFDIKKTGMNMHRYLLNYSGMDIGGLKHALETIKQELA